MFDHKNMDRKQNWSVLRRARSHIESKEILDEPENYLKEVLTEMCNYIGIVIRKVGNGLSSRHQF